MSHPPCYTRHMIMKEKTKTNGLKGYLKIYDPSTLEVHDCHTREYFKLSAVEVCHTTLNNLGDEFITYINPKTDRVCSSVVLWTLGKKLLKD